MLRTLVFAILALATVSTARAGDIDSSKVDLQCLLNKSEWFLISAQEKTVQLERFSPTGDDVQALELESFNTYRCPNCYSFVGTLNGTKYEGRTTAVFKPDTKSFDTSLSLKIDGVQVEYQMPCTNDVQN